MNDAIIQRIRRKSLANQVAIAVGSSLSEERFSIPRIAEDIISSLNLDFKVETPLQYFQRWNELVEKAEDKTSREYLVKFIKEKVSTAKPSLNHTKIASLPISNFIDATFDRALYKAITSIGKSPVLHDWNSQYIGAWQQTNPSNPNIFFSFCNLEQPHPWYGIYEPNGRSSQNRIQLMNIAEMLKNKDLILAGFSSYEAEFILNLPFIVSSCDKVINCITEIENPVYWGHRGVYIHNIEFEQLIDYLLPLSTSEYTFWDFSIPRRMIMDITRDKEYDCFISYFTGDQPFVNRLTQDLELRGLYIWMDKNEIDVGDSLSDKIQQGLSNSYSFVIILSSEALSRPWVKEELRAAYALRLAGESKILPVLYKECDIPLLLSDYRYADFRSENRYHEEILVLERSIKNAVNKARNKK